MFEVSLQRTTAFIPGLNAYLLAMALACAAPGTSQAQCSVTASTGYSVVAHGATSDIVPSSYSCQWGYNYNVRLAYEIEFNGTGAPGSMYTLQGNVVCGSQSLFFDLPNSGGQASRPPHPTRGEALAIVAPRTWDRSLVSKWC